MGKILDFWKHNKLVAFLIVYFLASVFYQAVCPYVPLRTPLFSQICGKAYWLESKEIPFGFYASLLEYKLGIHYPRVVSMADGGVGRPITVWLWRTTPTAEPPGTVFEVTFHVEGDGLIFTDEKGNEIAPVLSVPVGDDEARAPRRTIYIRRKPGTTAYAQAQLFVGINDPENGLTVLGDPIIVQLESSSSARIRRCLDFVLGTWTFSVLSVGMALIKFWIEQRERRRKMRRESLKEQIERLYNLPPSRIGLFYLDIWRKVCEESADLKELLKNAWVHIRSSNPYKPWLFQLRKNISEAVNKGLFEQAKKTLVEGKDAGLWDEGDISVEDVKEFVKGLKGEIDLSKINVSPDKYYLGLALTGFNALGIESARSAVKLASSVLERMNEDDGIQTLVRKIWYKGLADGNNSITEGHSTASSAAGRYLLRFYITEQTGEKRQTLEELVKKWEKEDPAPSRPAKGPCILWPDEPPTLSESHRRMIKSLGKDENQAHWYTPFGPAKAEEDPRLLLSEYSRTLPVDGLFWEGHPLWEQIIARHSGVFIAPPGSGRTAFIWMARNTRRFWGPKPALSIYLRLNGAPDASILLRKFSDALAASILCMLAEDPFWFLGAPERLRENIASFLLWQAGGHQELLQHLSACGLDGTDPNDPEARLLWEALLQYSPLNLPDLKQTYFLALLQQVCELLGEATRFRREEPFVPFTWVDIQENPAGWLEKLWNWAEFRRIGILKVFVDSDDGVKIEPLFYVHWSKEQLSQMLKWRLMQVGLDETGLWESMLSVLSKLNAEKPYGWHKSRWESFRKKVLERPSLDNLKEWLVDRAENPQTLINIGNSVMEACGALLQRIYV